jgi:hypothetical protein
LWARVPPSVARQRSIAAGDLLDAAPIAHEALGRRLGLTTEIEAAVRAAEQFRWVLDKTVSLT